MLKGQDDAAFEFVMQDLCAAFNRPYTPEITRVFWESLKHVHIAEVRRAALKHRNTAKKFPVPKDLMPERVVATPQPKEAEPKMSRWAVAANKILLRLAYQDVRRGFKPIATYPPMPLGGYGQPLQPVQPTDDSSLRKILVAKREYVGMAEQDEAAGQPWADEDFIALCREGFEKVLGTPARAPDEVMA